MTRAETRELIYKGIKALGNEIKFNSGRLSEFNKEQKEYPFIWLESLSAGRDIITQGADIDNWEVSLHIAKKDKPDSIPEEYEQIVDECDYIAQRLIGQYKSILSYAKLVTLSGVGREPFIHKMADDASGVILSFTLSSPDKTSVC